MFDSKNLYHFRPSRKSARMNLSEHDVKLMKVADLKVALQDRNLPLNGLKADLVNRLLESISKSDSAVVSSAETTAVLEAQTLQTKTEDDGVPKMILETKQPAEIVSNLEPGRDAVEICAPQAHVDVIGASKLSDESVDGTAIAPDRSVEGQNHEDEATGKIHNPVQSRDSDQRSEEKRLRAALLEKMALKKKEGKAEGIVAPKPTRTLRIDYFQRPLIFKSLKVWLESICNRELADSDIWLNGIKTHCYVDFESVQEAESVLPRIHGIKWPASNPNALEAHFTAVSAASAPKSAEAALKPGEWLAYKPSPSADPASAETGAGAGAKRKASVMLNALSGPGGAMTMLKQAAAVAASSASAQPSPSVKAPSGRIEGNEEVGFSTKRMKTEESTADERKSTALTSSNQGSRLRPDDSFQAPRTENIPKRNRQILSLDDLFRKTEAKPQLYWLPVPEEEASRRIKNKSSAQRNNIK